MNTVHKSLIFTPGATTPETISDSFSYLDLKLKSEDDVLVSSVYDKRELFI